MSMNGIDISNWQKGLNLAAVPCDFVIMKATEGTTFIDKTCNDFYKKAKVLGKCLGVYHYAKGGDAKAEAKFFLKNVKDYVGEAILVLDWESGGNSSFGKNDLTWCKTWCDYVYSKTGVKPLIYTSYFVMNKISGIVGDYKFWIAQYASNNPVYGYQVKPWNEGAYNCMMRQYTGAGRLSGYSGNLDLDKFYGNRSMWNKLAGKNTTTVSASTNNTKSNKLVVDGLFGPATVRKTQQFFKTTVDGVVSNQPLVNKKYLSAAVNSAWQFKNTPYCGSGSQVVKAMQKKFGAIADGYMGPATIKAMQKFLSVNVDGYMGHITVKAWQTWLNKH